MKTTAELIEAIEAQLGPLPEPLRAAYRAVDRARFVRPCDREHANDNWPLPLDTPHAQPTPSVSELLERYGSWPAVLAAAGELAPMGATISAPIMYALAFRVLGLAEGHRLLELGTGTGYGASLAAQVVGPRGHVTTVDVDPHLVAVAQKNTADLGNVTVVHADGLARADLMATHDRAWIAFSVADVPQALVDALPEGGQLLVPVGPPPPAPQRWMHYQRNGTVVERELPFPVFFIPARALVATAES
jgi:protein-L-isoaspartate(D-aspartate) O-methyltransferase